MSRSTLRKLGWDSRRMRILLRIDQWEYLESLARQWGVELPDVIPGFIAQGILDRRAYEPVELITADELAAREARADAWEASLGLGEAE
jgi:hypothetical protein